MRLFRLSFLVLLNLPAFAGHPLQPWLDAAAPGSVLRLSPGTYDGPAVIGKPLPLEGNGQRIIEARGE